MGSLTDTQQKLYLEQKEDSESDHTVESDNPQSDFEPGPALVASG